MKLCSDSLWLFLLKFLAIPRLNCETCGVNEFFTLDKHVDIGNEKNEASSESKRRKIASQIWCMDITIY